jgi:hypothetical protein
LDIEAALSDLIDDQDFIALNNRRAHFNLFEAVGAVRGELKNSNFLNFILSPARSHGLGTKPLQKFLRALLAKLPANKRPISMLEVSIGDLDNAIVLREADYIDLIIEVRDLNLLVVIENKVGAQAGEGQLARYKVVADAKYASWKKLFVFLTPEGRDPDHEDYIAFSYMELARLIENLFRDGATVYGPDVLLILEHYVEMIRRNIVDDEELRTLGQKIYERHAEAIDFILKCRPQAESLLPVAQELLGKNPSLVADKHGASILRFFSKEWTGVSALNSCPSDKWTRTGRNVLFEIKSFKSEGEITDRILLSLILGPSEAHLRKYIFDSIRAKPTIFSGAGKSIGQSWVTIFARELLTEAMAENMEDPQKKETISQNWNNFVISDLPKLTIEMLEIASSAPA